MGILERLRPTPRWKHTDPAVRVAAVYELAADDAALRHALGARGADVVGVHLLDGRKIKLRRARAINDGIQHALVGIMLHHQTLAGIIHADDKIPAGVLAEMIRRAAPQYLDRLIADQFER